MEPERRIEKLLRAFAKKRREQAGDPMEMHSVTRRQLQKEIARRSASPSRGGWFSSLFLRLRPRLAIALWVIALAAFGLFLLPNLKRPKPSTLASANLSGDKMVPAEKTLLALTPPPVSTTTPVASGEGTRAFDNKGQPVSGSVAMVPAQAKPDGANRQAAAPAAETQKQAEVLKNRIAETEVSTGAVAASTPPSTKEMFAFDAAATDSFKSATVAGTRALSKDATEQALPPAPQPTGGISVTANGTMLAANEDARKQPVAPATASAAFFERGKKESDAVIPPVSQVFNRSDVLTARRSTADTLSGPAAVLTSFRVEQTGNAIRVIDADGSVYTGAIQVAQQESAGQAAALKNAPAAAQLTKSAAPSGLAQNYFFRVAGTNHNLKQNVIFSGNLIPLTNAPVLAGRGGFGGGGGVGRAVALPEQSLLSNSRISGHVVIGDQKEIEVNATPAP